MTRPDLEFWVFWADAAVLALRPQRRDAEIPWSSSTETAGCTATDHRRRDGRTCGGARRSRGSGSDVRNRNAAPRVQPTVSRANLFGSDRSAEAVATADSRLGGSATIRRCELDGLDYAPGTFDRVLTNLPWGDQTPIRGPVYTTGISKLLDCVADDGSIVLLTSRRDLLEPTLRRLRARWSTTRVLVQGTWASIYVVGTKQ